MVTASYRTEHQTEEKKTVVVVVGSLTKIRPGSLRQIAPLLL